MTTQITVRLPDDNVAWLDAEVAAGRFPSRTAGLAKLLTKAQRRQEDEADMLKILAGPDPDEGSRLKWMRTRQYPPIDDDLNYSDEQHSVSTPDAGAAQVVGDRTGANQTTGESGRPANAPAASIATRARDTAADPDTANETANSK